MKKNYFLTCLLACFVFSLKLSAQMNGVYTINSSILPSTSNFTSFTAFSASLNAGGVSGPVTVNVLANSNYTEQINFNQAAGISATNSVTINGNGATITFSLTSATLLHTILLTGADFMTFNNLNIVGTGLAQALTVHLWSGANNNTFNNCTFSSPIVGTVAALVPFSVSGTSISATGTGLSGNNNTVNSCTITGGYYGTAFYCATTTPFNTGNSVINSVVRDFYTAGSYNGYCQVSTFKNNIYERVNRTTITSSYGVYCTTGSVNTLVDGNIIRKLFNGITASASLSYPIYIVGDATIGNENIIRNNLISDINSAGTIIGIYISGGAFANVYHNTISLDDNTATAGTTYGIESTGPSSTIKNNIVTIGRSGTGAKYGIYFTTAATSLQCDYNDVFISSTTGTGNLPFYLGSGYTLANWQFSNPTYDQSSKDVDPMYTNPSLMNYVPTSTVVNNMCLFIGVASDITGFTRSTTWPDPGAYESYTLACTGSAPTNSIIAPGGVLCPNSTVQLSIANSFTNTGYSVQWQSSPGLLGPYTAVSGASLTAYSISTLTATTFYNALISCVNGGATVTALVGQVQIAPPTINTVTYNEGFEGIGQTFQLPNCSWAASNPGITGSTLTYTNINTNNRFPRTGSNFASFAKLSSASSYFYSNGIYMSPGITYSASVWYINESVGYTAWPEFSLLVGLTQTYTAMSTIATTTNMVLSYSSLSNTFQVNTAGVYYLGIKATSSSGSSPYLSWDDLQVIVPCSLNSPPLVLSSNASTICANTPVILTASGAPSYTWSTGQSSAIITASPSIGTIYTVSSTNTLSGCTSVLTKSITVKPAPLLTIFATDMDVCVGESTILSAQGGISYSWADGSFGSTATVTPTTATTYSVVGVNSFSCAAMQNITINVNSLPNVSAGSSTSKLCRGESVVLTGSGAQTYVWASASNAFMTGSPLTVQLQTSTAYTVTGTDANGCSNIYNFVVEVDECTGINELANDAASVNVHPNPTAGVLHISSNMATLKTYSVFDIAGRMIAAGELSDLQGTVDISALPDGVYNLSVFSGEVVKHVRIIKAAN